jgi:hypothetical protein
LRRSCAAFAVIISSVVLAQDDSRDVLLEWLAQAGTETAAAAIRGLEELDPAVRDQLAPTLAAWIVEFRDAALARGVEEIPPEIREALAGFVPEKALDSVRWRAEHGAPVEGGSLFQAGSIRAVTLDHVIVFTTAAEAADATLWAHEIFHVMQYRKWGVDGFARRYLADHGAIEHEAKEFRWQWMKATGRVPPSGISLR